MGELVARAHHEFAESVARDELRMEPAPFRRLSWRWRRTAAVCGFAVIAVGVTVALAVTVALDVAVAMAVCGSIRDQLDHDRFTCREGNRLAQQLHVMAGDPVAEEFIGRFNSCGLTFQRDEFERLDPGFKANLSHDFPQTIPSFLPDTVHP